MSSYLKNVQTLRKCQLAYDAQEPPEYWNDAEIIDDDDEEYREEVDYDE